VNADGLKLTTYFGERDRTGSRLLADELLDLYGRHAVATSVLLRGIEGFGLGHHLHTDRLLTLSEDLPVVSVAVDTRERIEAIMPEVLAIKQRGLLTLERARLLSGRLGEVRLDEELHEATKITLYVGRQERAGGRAAFVSVCETLHRCGFSGATVLLGVDGTRDGMRQRARFFGRNAEVPMMVIAVGPRPSVSEALSGLDVLLRNPTITLERVRVCKRDGRLLARPHELPETDEQGLGLWQKLMIHSSETARHDGRPLHQSLVRRLRQANVVGATTLRGIWGFYGDHAPQGDRLLQLRRHVPVVTIVVDTPERIATTFEIVDEVTSATGLVTSEMVPAAAPMGDDRRTGGIRLARHRF
jgi:PII-like signaling protein